MVNSLHITAESDSEKILKIGQHLPKLWSIKYRVVFFMKHGVLLLLLLLLLPYYCDFTTVGLGTVKQFGRWFTSEMKCEYIRKFIRPGETSIDR